MMKTLKDLRSNPAEIYTPEKRMSPSRAIRFLHLHEYQNGNTINNLKLNEEVMDLVGEVFFSCSEEQLDRFFLYAEAGDREGILSFICSVYGRLKMDVPEKIWAFAAVPSLWNEYVRRVSSQLSILRTVCDDEDQIYELEEYEE